MLCLILTERGNVLLLTVTYIRRSGCKQWMITMSLVSLKVSQNGFLIISSSLNPEPFHPSLATFCFPQLWLICNWSPLLPPQLICLCCLCCLYLIYPSPFLLVSYCLHLFSFCLIILLAYGFCLLILQTFLSCLPVLFLIELRVWLILVTLLLMFVLSGLTKQSEPEWCVCACLLISEVCVQDYLVSSEHEVQLLQCH